MGKNNCNPEFQATRLKGCSKKGYSRGDLIAKRRCLRSNTSSISLQYKNSGTIELSSDSEDENQNMFLKVSGEKIDARSLEDDIDFGYKMFLEHVREDGKSYVLEMLDAHDGKPICVKYEGNEVSSDEGEIPIRSKSDEGDPQNQMNSDGISKKGRSACLGKKNQESHTSGLACHGMNRRRSCDKSGQSSLHSSSPDNNQKNESLVDESYQTFLNHVRVHDDSLAEELENESLVDESYQTYLNHVRVHGDSLVLELENGVVVKYEEEVEVRTVSSGEDVSSDRGESLVVESYQTFLNHVRVHDDSLAEELENESLVDESYQTFLNHVRVHGDSLVLELENGVVVKYEEEVEVRTVSSGEDVSSDRGDILTTRKYDEGEPQDKRDSGILLGKRRTCPRKKKQKSRTSGLISNRKNKSTSNKSGQTIHRSQENDSLVDGSYPILLTRKYDEGEPQDKRDSGILLGKRRTCPRKKKQKSHKSGLISNRKNKSTSDKSGRTIHRSQENDSLVDESYPILLNHVSVHGDSLVLELDNDVVVKCEEENEVCTASEGSSAKSTPCCDEPELESHTTSQQHSDSSACEHDVSSLKSGWCGSQFQFKEELMVCLNRPFDQEEHDMLLDEAKTQKRSERSRDLRSRSVSYATKGRSSSYFDHYPDLERQIMFSNPHKSLTLLRGFFFWLKNLSHEGAFPPWRTLPQDGQIVLFSANETATPAQVVMPEGIKEKSGIQLIEIEVPADVTEEKTGMQPIQIEMAEDINAVTNIQPIQIEIVSGTEESEVQPIEISNDILLIGL
ncbi:hypothetical protein AAC387_Pa02g2385 [Persea americana]